MVAELTEEAPSILRQLERDGATPLHIAAYCDRVEEIEKLIAEGASTDAKDLRGATVLYSAAEKGNVRAIECLLEHGARIDESGGGNSPLEGAVLYGRVQATELLLKRGAQMGDNLLNLAARLGHEGVMEVLIRFGADINRVSKSFAGDESPLLCATRRRHIGCVQLLIRSGVDLGRPSCTVLENAEVQSSFKIPRSFSVKRRL